MAPEVVQELPYTYYADVWSLGVILYELVNGKINKRTCNDQDLLRKKQRQHNRTSSFFCRELARVNKAIDSLPGGIPPHFLRFIQNVPPGHASKGAGFAKIVESAIE